MKLGPASITRTLQRRGLELGLHDHTGYDSGQTVERRQARSAALVSAGSETVIALLESRHLPVQHDGGIDWAALCGLTQRGFRGRHQQPIRESELSLSLTLTRRLCAGVDTTLTHDTRIHGEPVTNAA